MRECLIIQFLDRGVGNPERIALKRMKTLRNVLIVGIDDGSLMTHANHST